jgi:hypothetical protein
MINKVRHNPKGFEGGQAPKSHREEAKNAKE